MRRGTVCVRVLERGVGVADGSAVPQVAATVVGRFHKGGVCASVFGAEDGLEGRLHGSGTFVPRSPPRLEKTGSANPNGEIGRTCQSSLGRLRTCCGAAQPKQIWNPKMEEPYSPSTGAREVARTLLRCGAPTDGARGSLETFNDPHARVLDQRKDAVCGPSQAANRQFERWPPLLPPLYPLCAALHTAHTPSSLTNRA